VNTIWCDVIPITVTHILLGSPWLYDQDVYHCEKTNTYRFTLNDEKTVLKHMSAEKIMKYQEKSKNVAEIVKKCLHTPIESKLEYKSKEIEVEDVVVVEEVRGEDAFIVEREDKFAVNKPITASNEIVQPLLNLNCVPHVLLKSPQPTPLTHHKSQLPQDKLFDNLPRGPS